MLEHADAAARTVLACIDALFHAVEVSTAGGTFLANASARAAQILVQNEVREHGIRGQAAQVRADRHQTKVTRLDVRPALLQAMIHRHAETNAITALAVLDALFHIGDGMSARVHGEFLGGPEVGAGAPTFGPTSIGEHQ